MKSISIFNEVLGPVMRGPSSSHTAASYNLAVLARALLGDDRLRAATFTFDPSGSYGKVFQEQGSDLAFAAGLMGWRLTDERFGQAVESAATDGLAMRFVVAPLPEADHPNTVRIELASRRGRTLRAVGRSIGGGSIEVVTLEGWPVLLTGECHEVLVEARGESATGGTGAAGVAGIAAVAGDKNTHAKSDTKAEDEILCLLTGDGQGHASVRAQRHCANTSKIGNAGDDTVLYIAERDSALPAATRAQLEALPQVWRVWAGCPLCFVKKGQRKGQPQNEQALFDSAAAMVALAQAQKISLGEVAQCYEARLLEQSAADVSAEMDRRLSIMENAVRDGLEESPPTMQLLRPTAGKVFAAEAAGRVAIGGPHTRAAARAMAAMHINCGMGVVCAAPTAGSAGVLPGVAVTLLEELGVPRKQVVRGLLAAGAVGVVLAERATFAAEVAGCQVEIGAAGAMAAALVVEATGGSAQEAADAAAISFQNTMGSVCDLVQGIVEIPCHTRNAVAASAAFVCADLILGGYENPIPLDETIDAVYQVGKQLPAELKVTALGGLALAPSAKALKRQR